MKKLFLLIPALLLVGCGSAKNVSFNGNLKYDKPLTEEQVKEFLKNFKEASKKAKELKINTVSSEKHGFVEKETSGETTLTIFSNGTKSEYSGKVDSFDNGVSYLTKDTGSENTWVITKDGSSKLVTASKTSDSEETEIEVENYEAEEISVGFFATTLGLPAADLDNVKFYKNGKEYALVFSKEDKTVLDENPVLGQKKDLIQTRDRQLVIDVDKDYKIKAASYFDKRGVNRDPDTNEWYKKVKTTSQTQTSMKVTYGEVAARSETELFDILKKEDKEFFVGVKPLLKMGFWDGTSAKPVEAAFTLNPSFSDVEVTENELTNTVQYQARFALSADANAFLKSMNAEATYLTKDGFKTKTTSPTGTITDQYYSFNTSTTSDTSPVQFMYKLNSVGDEFNLRFTLALGETISFIGNPTVYDAF